MPAIHAALFIVILLVVAIGLPSLLWPWYLVLPLLVYGGAVLTIKPLRQTAPKLAVGRLSGGPLAAAAILAVITTGVLIGFHALFRPDMRDLAARLPRSWFGNIVLAGVCFSIVNAILEELIFRGVLWEAVAQEWNSSVALGVTAVLFGAGHLDGYPPGPTGAILAGIYGLLLGGLRWWTGGLGLAAACHVFADATIFCILVMPGESGDKWDRRAE
jgi:membrane protease YdiL (CAAX protease family)